MKPLAAAAMAAVTLVAPALQAQRDRSEPAPGVLASVEWLTRHHSDSNLVLLQVERSRAPYDSAHIPGARFVGMDQFTSRRGDLLTELPPLEQLDSLFESLGIGHASRVVLYGETLPTTRLFFTLEYAGLSGRVSVLNGGLATWKEAGGAVTAEATASWGRGSLTLDPQRDLLADLEWVRAHQADPGVLLLDARTRSEYDGKVQPPTGIRAGHIPGAASLDWTTTISGGRFLEREALKTLLVGAGATTGKELVTYCQVGTRASALYFVARLLGYTVRVYDGSMNEWAARADVPVATNPPGGPAAPSGAG